MELIVCKTPEEVGKVCGDLFIDLIQKKPNAVLGLATGSTPIPTYKYLVKAYKEGRVSFKDVKTFNLDEYCGISRDNDQSYYYFMHENLFNDIDIKEENTHVPFAESGKEEECATEYTKLVDSQTIDLQLLGIGGNGHIGFNEPNTPFDKSTWIVTLTENTRQANKRFFKSIDEVPTKAITMGINDIMKAKKIVLVVTGDGKKETLKRLMEHKVCESFPASVLENHKDVIVIADEAAASLL